MVNIVGAGDESLKNLFCPRGVAEGVTLEFEAIDEVAFSFWKEVPGIVH